MDSTKKVTKKLSGAAAGTAAWCTNVGNEHGQVLVSVMTAGEGQALDAMAAGLMKHYREAGEPQPKIMYVDRDCCTQHGPCRVKTMFAEWDGLQVRLDIWHFMRRFAAGVTTEAHPSMAFSWHACPDAFLSGIPRMLLLFAVPRRVS